MRTIMLIAGAVTVVAASAPAAEACSLRGRFCGYPYWAANAFEGRFGRGPDIASGPNVPRLYGYSWTKPRRYR